MKIVHLFRRVVAVAVRVETDCRRAGGGSRRAYQIVQTGVHRVVSLTRREESAVWSPTAVSVLFIYNCVFVCDVVVCHELKIHIIPSCVY